MPQLDFDGANSKISADKIQGQSGTTVTIPAGHNLAGDGSGLTGVGLTSKVITGTYDVSTTGDLVVTGTGFTPTAVVSFVSVDSNAAWSAGMCGSTITDDGDIHNYHNQNADKMNTSNDLWHLYTASNTIAKGVVKTYDANGATFTKTKSSSPTGTAYYRFLFFK
jgi:hypothetical protein